MLLGVDALFELEHNLYSLFVAYAIISKTN